MKKTLPNEFIERGWKAKNITIKGKNITNVPDKEIYKLAKTVLSNVCNNKESKNNAKKARVNLFHIEADLDDGSHISIPFIVRKCGDEWYYLSPEYLMEEKKRKKSVTFLESFVIF